MCQYEENLKRIMARLNQFVTLPPTNSELLAMRLRIYKNKYHYTYNKLFSELHKKTGIPANTIINWYHQKKTPKKESYDKIMNFLEIHS